MTASTIDLLRIMTDAEWLAHRYDPGHDAFHMRHVPRQRHAEVPFLTDACLGELADPLILRRSDAMAAASAPAPLHFIFHSAYCCSTLLAAAFDIPGMAMGLKEPVLLNDIIGWRHQGAKGPDVARVLDEGLRLLARPFEPGGAVVVKPSNVVNPLIPAIMTLQSGARAVLLYAPLEAYLASIARKGMWGRLWVRDLFGKLIREAMIAPLGISPDQYLGLTDIQVAAVGWLAQQHQFKMLLERFGDRMAALNSDTLMAHPVESMIALSRHFRLDLGEQAARAIVNGPVFAKDAKSGGAFGADQRSADARQGLTTYAEEIQKVLVWARTIAEQADIPMNLPER